MTCVTPGSAFIFFIFMEPDGSIYQETSSFLLHLFPIVHHHHHHGTHLISEAHWSAADPKHGSAGVPGSNDLIIKIKTSNYL